MAEVSLIVGKTVWWNRRCHQTYKHEHGLGQVLQSTLGDDGAYHLLVSRRDINSWMSAANHRFPPGGCDGEECPDTLVTVREQAVVEVLDTQPEGPMPSAGPFRDEG